MLKEATLGEPASSQHSIEFVIDDRETDVVTRYIIGLTLGPTFLSASLYLSIGSLQRHYDIKVFSFIGPQLFATIFIIGDFLCLCFIGCGGSLAAIYANEPIGVDLMIAGLGLQVLTTTIFCLFLAKAVHTLRSRVFGSTRRWFIIGTCSKYNPSKQLPTNARRWLGVSIAAFCLLVRSCWRVAELSDGFNGPLASKENIFIGLDSIPVVIMSVLLTLLHPRFWFREPSTKREGLILLDCRRN